MRSRRPRLRHRLFATATMYALVMMGLAAALAWQVRASHRELAAVVRVDVDQSRALSELQQMLRALAREWSLAADEQNFQPSAAAMERMVTASEEWIRESALPEDLEPEFRELTARSRRAAEDWRALEPQQRRIESAALARLASRLSRAFGEERNSRERRLAAALVKLERRAGHSTWAALAIVYIVAVVSFVFARRTLNRVVIPIERLGSAADRIARGELDTRVGVAGDHELAHLSERFNEMALALAESHKRLQDVANTDELTGLPNFRTFSRRLEEEIERAQRYELTFGLLILDLDRFKKYNDTFGHQAGNEALVAVATGLRGTLRSVDIAARFGGEELAVIAPQTDAESLAALAERIRSSIAELPPIEDRTPLTVSIGGAICPADGLTSEELFKVADQRLYRAKSDGRNRAVTDDTPRAVTRKNRRRG